MNDKSLIWSFYAKTPLSNFLVTIITRTCANLKYQKTTFGTKKKNNLNKVSCFFFLTLSYKYFLIRQQLLSETTNFCIQSEFLLPSFKYLN